jgi:hypothetical protein
VDAQCLLRWVKNGNLIDTTIEFTDSEEGIVRADDEGSKSVRPPEEGSAKLSSDSDASSSTSASSAISGMERADKYVNDKQDLKKMFLISPQTVMNGLLRKTTRKNT